MNGLGTRGNLVSLFVAGVMLALVYRPASADNSLTIAFSNFPPMAGKVDNLADGDGLLIDFYAAVLPKLGYEVRLIQMPLARIFRMLQEGREIDLYPCSDISRKSRPHYAFGPPFVALNIVLYQNARQSATSSFKDLKGETILKQHGLKGVTRAFDPSNSFFDASYTALPGMFARGRADYLVDFHERMELLLDERADLPEYRIYPIRTFRAHLCLNRRFDDAEARIQTIHDAMVAFQDTPEGKALFLKYRYSGRFGENRIEGDVKLN